jgi:hypothetical protein
MMPCFIVHLQSMASHSWSLISSDSNVHANKPLEGCQALLRTVKPLAGLEALQAAVE